MGKRPAVLSTISASCGVPGTPPPACHPPRLSELRIIELLEGLCESMGSYTLVPPGEGTPARWASLKSAGVNQNFNMPHIENLQKRLKTYCADLIEQFEDQVAHAIRATEHDADGACAARCLRVCVGLRGRRGRACPRVLAKLAEGLGETT